MMNKVSKTMTMNKKTEERPNKKICEEDYINGESMCDEQCRILI